MFLCHECREPIEVGSVDRPVKDGPRILHFHDICHVVYRVRLDKGHEDPRQAKLAYPNEWR